LVTAADTAGRVCGKKVIRAEYAAGEPDVTLLGKGEQG
jgi:hypothetical protein